MSTPAKLKWRSVAKWGLYALIAFVLYILQVTPNVFVFWGVKPDFLLPCAVGVALLEGDFRGGLFAVVCGLLYDMAFTRLFGFNGLLFLTVCVCIGLLSLYYFRPNLINFLLFSVTAMLLVYSVNFVFKYLIWGYSGAGMYYVRSVLLCAAWSLLFSPAIYFALRSIHRRLSPSED